MNSIKRMFLAFALLLGAVSTLHADNVGYIDLDRVLFNYKESKKIQEEVQKRREGYQKEYDSRQKELEQAKKTKKDAEIQALVSKMESELKPKQEEVLKYEMEVQRGLLTKVTKTAQEIASGYGIDVILDRRVVLVGGFDLTDFVVTALNKQK